MSDALSPALTSVLRSARSELNARFAAARLRHPDLDGDAFVEFIRSAVDPLVLAAEAARPDRATDVAYAAYDMGLELVGQKLVGRSARAPFVGDAWRRVLPQAASLVAAEPERLIAAVCNASHHIAATGGTRPSFWIDTMSAVAGKCADSETFLNLGHVVAWRAGMAHLRESALAAADKLPESLVPLAIDAPAARWLGVRDRLLADPWFDPANPRLSDKPRVAARAGAFRGFGGLFIEPPIVAIAGEQLLARGGDECWLVKADAFGATFHRATADEFENAKRQPALPPDISLRDSVLTVRGERIELRDLAGEVTSICSGRTTLALTSPFTHGIVLVALPPAE